MNITVLDQGATGMTLITTPTSDITTKILLKELISSLVNHIVQRILTVGHSNGPGITVAGGRMEHAKRSLTLHCKTPTSRRAEKVKLPSNIDRLSIHPDQLF